MPRRKGMGTTAIVVAFVVTAEAGASGTYQLGFLSYPALGGNSWMLGPQEPLRCGYYGELVAGSGQPNYDQGLVVS